MGCVIFYQLFLVKSFFQLIQLYLMSFQAFTPRLDIHISINGISLWSFPLFNVFV